MKRRRVRGFVAGEPFIVLATFAVICFVAAWGIASILKWSFGSAILLALLAFAAGIGAFAVYARLNRTD